MTTMCEECWKDVGRPMIYNDRVARAVECVRRLYAVHGVGGALHVVVDDWNVDDGYIDFCERQANEERAEYDPEDEPQRYEIETECIAALRALSVDERYSALALETGLFAVEEKNIDG